MIKLLFLQSFNRFLFLFFLVSVSFSVSAQVNLVQRSLVPFPGQTVAGVWHYVDSLNREYALVGTRNGISIVDVSNPVAPVFILQVPGIANLWHEVKTWGTYAYATTEGADSLGINDGLQIIDLRFLPDSAPSKYWQGDGKIAGKLHRAHSLQIDNGYVYINGHNISALRKGVLIADLADPWNPHFVGADTVNYCHDSFIRGDRLFTSDLNAGFSVFDISDRSNPVLLASHPTPFNFNHNAWLSDDSKVLFTTDERNHAPLAAFDVSNLSNIDLLDKYTVLNIVNVNASDEVHNTRVFKDFLVNACYGSQVTIVDAARPANLIEVGNFPINTPLAWDADPYLPSGNILATGEFTGLHILSPTYVRACYLEGLVTDSITGFPLNNARITILLTYVKDSTILTGEYKTGYVNAGTFDVLFSKPGYFPKVISGVLLNNGVLTTLDVQLVPDFTGIAENQQSSFSFIHPNPFHESAELVMDQKFFSRNAPLTIVLNDITGRVVRMITDVTSSTIRIDRNGLGSGMYFYELRNEVSVIDNGRVIVE